MNNAVVGVWMFVLANGSRSLGVWRHDHCLWLHAVCHMEWYYQFSGSNADQMKKAYGKFCSRHNEAVNLYKDLHAKDKRFQAFIKVSPRVSLMCLTGYIVWTEMTSLCLCRRR